MLDKEALIKELTEKICALENEYNTYLGDETIRISCYIKV